MNRHECIHIETARNVRRIEVEPVLVEATERADEVLVNGRRFVVVEVE